MNSVQYYSRISRLSFVLKVTGASFLKVAEFASVVKRYVFGETVDGETCTDVVKSASKEEEDERFVSETKSMLYLCPDLMVDSGSMFQDFHQYTLNCGLPIAVILMSDRENCRVCNNKLITDQKKRHAVVIYDNERGTHIGCRVTKFCRKCTISEHYGFWTVDGERRFDMEVTFRNKYLLSSEDTAFENSIIKMYSNLLIVGAVPFSTFAMSYNRRHGYNKTQQNEKVKEPAFKRKRRENSADLKELLRNRESMDRRRFEEGFLLFACLEAIKKHDLQVSVIPYDRNELVEMVTGQYHQQFIKKWGDHLCETPGCKSVLVMDGNMKNARQVCACTNVSELQFPGINGSISIGCPKSPAKGIKYCDEHKEIGSPFINDSHIIDGKKCKIEMKSDNYQTPMITEIVNEKCTRQDTFYEVKWSDGRKSWVKESNLPVKVKECVKDGKWFQQEMVVVNELGQQRTEFQFKEKLKNSLNNELKSYAESSGFGVERSEDNEIEEESGNLRKMLCGTEKGRHKAKNHRTAGILVMEKPCSVVVDVVELFGSESKSQVYAHLHNLLEKPIMQNTNVICYDDACHLKRFAQNPKRSGATEVSLTMSKMEMVCDKFHFGNHVDSWCKKNCNPYKCCNLEGVNTEVCEQLFSWLSRFSHMTKHMNRWRFLFMMLYVLDNHNEDVTK